MDSGTQYGLGHYILRYLIRRHPRRLTVEVLDLVVIPVKSVRGVVIPELQQLKLFFGPVVRKLGFPADIPL